MRTAAIRSNCIAVSRLACSCCWRNRRGGRHSQDAAPSLAAQEEAALRAAAARVADSVVQIRTIGGLDAVDGTLLGQRADDRPGDFGRRLHRFERVQFRAAAGVDPGHFATGKQAPAELVATDHSRMLVLLKVTGVSGLAVPEAAPADEIRAGPVGGRRRPNVSRRSHQRLGRHRRARRTACSAR